MDVVVVFFLGMFAVAFERRTALNSKPKIKLHERAHKLSSDRAEPSPVSFSVFLTSFFVSSAQDSGMESKKRHSKCLPVIFLMMMMRSVDRKERERRKKREKSLSRSLNKSQICQALLWTKTARESRTCPPVGAHL